MSLINEALRKARQAASEHDAKPPDGAFQPVKAYPSRRSNRRSGTLVVAVIAVAAGVLGASAAWWFLSDRQVQSSEPIVSKGQPVVTSPPVATPDPSPVQDNGSVEPVTSGRKTELAETPVVVPAAEMPPATDAEQTVEKPRLSKPVIGSDGERVFVMEAELGYASLSLGYIVARSTNPFAEINGIEVYVGSEVDGFVVEGIESDRVILRDDVGLLTLRVP